MNQRNAGSQASSRRPSLRILTRPGRVVALLTLAFAAAVGAAHAATPAAAPTLAPALVIDGLGKGTAPLDGPWQFHLGDNPAWAAPAADDATGVDGWEQITADKPWGAQGHRSYAGYAWYRRHLHLIPAPGAAADFSLLIPKIEDAYEIYWNGALVGREGSMPPHPSYIYSQPAQIFTLGQARDGVLAVRVWKEPLGSFDSGLQGGFLAAPLVGSAAAIADHRAAANYRWLHSRQYYFGLHSLYGLVMVLSFLAWLRYRSEKLLLWMSLYCLAGILNLVVIGLQLPVTYDFGLGLLQPINGLFDISLWFLLLYLLRLTDSPRLVRLTIVLSVINMTANVLDGALAIFWNSPLFQGWGQTADAILTVFVTLPQLLPLFLVLFGLTRKLDTPRRLVAFFAFAQSFIIDLRIAVEQGSRYTHWTLADKITATLFTINGNPFSVLTLAAMAMLISIIIAVYSYSREEVQRQQALEQELRSAQEIQRVLVPETLPALEGFAITSAYQPAQQVGGDFFQLIAKADGSALLIVGDVSGKGLKAAMTVSLIVGTVRTLAESFDDPAEILARLNRRMHGRLHHGFVTCLVLRLDPGGECVIANAGHPAPFLNAEELDLPDALPLGPLPSASYETTAIRLAIGDRLTLYTDGLLEARNPAREIFGFERLRSLVGTNPDARQAIEAAIAFGQEDDITVLTLTRLAVGETSSTQLSAPELAPA